MAEFIEIEDKRYPVALKKLGSLAPKRLYYKGNWPASPDERASRGGNDIFNNCLAVVGSRHLTYYGRKATEQLVTEIAAAGVTIVSGFMYGGDEAAHSAAVKCGGKTIAVMPCGINIIHPPQHKKLYQEILDSNGLIISEYENDFQPITWSYVQRNRIVAGLSKAIFVTEAALNSGSLITANYAKKFGKKIFALPGQITSEVSKGTIKLIKEGAEPVTEANDILKYYKVLVSQRVKRCPTSQNFVKSDLTKTGLLEERIIDHLRREPLEADNLARVLAVSVSQLGTALSLMQLKGIINSNSGKYYLN